MPGYRSIWTYLNTVPHKLAFLDAAIDVLVRGEPAHVGEPAGAGWEADSRGRCGDLIAGFGGPVNR